MRARATSSSSIALSMPNGQQAGKERPAVAEEEGATDNAALRRKAYVDAGREAFLDAGFGATTMSSIAALVGGSKTTLWPYFPSKKDRFEAWLAKVVAVTPTRPPPTDTERRAGGKGG